MYTLKHSDIQEMQV